MAGPSTIARVTFDGRIEGQMVVPAGVSITATNSGGPTTVSITAGTYYPSELVAHLAVRLNAVRTPANWTATLSTGASGTGKVSINWTGSGTYSIAWTANGTTLRDVLGFTADLTAITQGVASVSTKQARGLWIPDCPMNLSGDVPRAPLITDAMPVVSPRGDVTVLVGNSMYRHVGVRYAHVLEAKVWEVAAAIVNASWETFWKDVYLGQGSISWFTPGSKLKLVDHAGRTLGSDAAITGWRATRGPFDTEVRKVDKAWAGMWMIEIPELVSSG
jgi:hypothetical protein